MLFAGTQAPRSLGVADESSDGEHTYTTGSLENSQTSRGLVQYYKLLEERITAAMVLSEMLFYNTNQLHSVRSDIHTFSVHNVGR